MGTADVSYYGRTHLNVPVLCQMGNFYIVRLRCGANINVHWSKVWRR